jgi:hypothetical protein
MNVLILSCGRIRKLGKSSYDACSSMNNKFNKCMFCMILVCVWLLFWQDQDQKFISAVPSSHKLSPQEPLFGPGGFNLSIYFAKYHNSTALKLFAKASRIQRLISFFLWFDSDTKNHPQIFEVFESLSENEYKFVWRCPIGSKMENGVKSHLEF